MNNVLFKTTGLNKHYPGTHALKDASLEIRKGEVIGLIGENGAGKSTLLKIITGVEKSSSGSMMMAGNIYNPQTPLEANRMGIGMVFQEQSLITNLTVGQNIFFGHEKEYTRGGFIDWKTMYSHAGRVLSEMGLDHISVRKKVREMDFASRQMVEIAKVLNSVKNSSTEGALILLDEPTSVLTEPEIRQLKHEVCKLKENGNSVIFVSHRLDEIMDFSDRIYIFKDGGQVGEVDTSDSEEKMLYEKMVGRTSTGEYFKIEQQKEPSDTDVLKVSNLSSHGHFKNISFNLRRGEVLGIAGVVGSGKEELCSVLCGDESPISGTMEIHGKPASFSSPCDALKSGILSIPKERREESIAGNLSILENISLSNFSNVKSGGLISRRKQIDKSLRWIDKLRIKCSGHDELVSSLSGGNAQKVVFSRVLDSNSEILIFNHPTRGVDVGAKEEIYQLVRDITAEGKSVILLGDSLDECIGLIHRVLVMKDGMVTADFDAAAGQKPRQVDIVQNMM